MEKYLFIVILVIKMFFVEACYASFFVENNSDTVKTLFFLDGKQVPYSVIKAKGEKGELGGGIGAGDSKTAIKLYGEKFRYGVAFINSRENQDNFFQLIGKIDTKYNGNLIMLFTFQQDTIFSVDTTTIKNGEFYFRGKEYLGDFSIVSTGNYPDKVVSSEVILNKGIIHVDLDSINRVWGGELNDKLFVFQDSTRILFEKLKSLSENSSPNESIKIIDDLMKTYLYDFMIENQNNLLGMHTFKGYLGYFTLTDSVRFEILCDIFDKERKSDLVKSHLEYRDKYAQRLQDVGKKYEDFEFQSPEGDARKLSDYVGKLEYIYLDFWASWCGPCIADMPHLKEIYEKYKDKGFEIIGISLDTDRQSWINALNRIETPWTQLCDFEGAQSKVAEAYHIKGIPKGILLNKEGIIVETNLRGSTFLDKKIQELFD